jgi:hypothetical protein
MASLENQQQPFPVMPPSFSAGGHEMRDYYADSSAPRPSPNQSPYLTPYLGLRARLSQVWINRWTVLLLLVLVRLLLALANAGDLVNDARDEALSACTSVEQVGSTMASVSHYAAQGFNQLTASSITKAVSGLQSMTSLMLTSVEEMVVFYIGMLTNTYLCLITFAVGGSLHAVDDVLSAAEKQIQGTLSGIGDDVTGVANGLKSSIQQLANGVNSVFGAGGQAPNIDFSSSVNKLKNFKMPTGLDSDLQKLNKSIPTFGDVKNLTDNAIRIPFEDVRTLIKNNWSNYTFDHSLLPVPQKEELSFCQNNQHINNFFEDLRGILHTAKKVFIGVLLTLAIVACIPMALLEMRRFIRQQIRSKLISKFTKDPMDAAYLFARPYSSDVGKWAAKKSQSTRKQILIRWFVSYCTSLPALVLLSLALAGLFSCLMQYMFLKVIEREVPKLTAEVAEFGAEIVTKLNNASASWATDTNAIIINEGGKLNKDLFSWVNVSTIAINNTLNTFVDETMHVLNVTFGGTPLYDPIQEVFNCLIGLKVMGIEKGLTWVHDNAHIDFPLLSNDTLTGGALLSKASPGAKDFFADPKSVTQNDVSRAVSKVGAKLEKGIRQEAIIFTLLLVAYLTVVLSGLAAVIFQSCRRDKVRGDAGHEYATHDFGSSHHENYDQILGPAPAYTTTNHDLNAHAPYTLNPHPIPRNDVDDYQPEKHTPANEISVLPSDNNQAYHNEKNGFI